jgi:hypothetical protein
MKGRKRPELPEPNIDRIFAVVPDVPKDFDETELLADLKGAISFYQQGKDLRHQPALIRRKLEGALKVTEKLDNDLGRDPRFQPFILKLERRLLLALAELDPKLGHRYRRALREVDPERARRLRALAKANPTKLGLRIRLAFRNPLSPWLGYPRVSAFDNLVGGWLADIYEKHFKQEIRRTRRDLDNSITSLFIDFVEVVLAEFHIDHGDKPYTRRAIDSAFRRGRATTAKSAKK